MRKTLLDLIENTIFFKYSLPSRKLNISKISISTCDDKCYETTNDLSSVIYNGIVDYSYNEDKIDITKLNSLHKRALLTKLRYFESASRDSKVKYGLYGEILLFLILQVKFGAETLISRGFFYNPLEASETKGYDTYQLVEKNNENVELWFGEVKFYKSYKAGLKKIFDNIEKALSNEYLEKNIIAMSDRGSFNLKGSKIESILNSWEENPSISIIEEVQKNNMSFVYPMLLIFEDNKNNYDNIINEVVDHINLEYSKFKINLSIPVKVFFIFLPVSDVIKIKKEVIEWIEESKPVI